MSGERGFSIRIPQALGTWIFFAPFVAFLLFVAGTSGWALWMQYWRLRTYVPVEAVVVSSGVVHHGEHSDSWEPVVHYRYPADAPMYDDSRVPPIRTVGSEMWARNLARRFSPGQRVTAYRDQVHHGDAFLIREPQYDRVPWFLVPLFILSLGVYIGRWSRERPSTAG
ncbi:MAG TPA: DUF3592 domain-containing protein [Longimicrobium sp.]|nr:DUF3592 domain-containing protein [Longimicrobium sp.]